MKKDSKDMAVSMTAYHSKEVATLIISVPQTIRLEAIDKAEQLAESKLPSSENTDLNDFTSWITAKFNALLAQVLTLLNVEGLKAKGASLLERFENKERELTEERQELESKIREAKKEVKSNNAEDLLSRIRKWHIVHPIIILLVLAEAIAMEGAMGLISSAGIIARVVIALFLCVCTYFIAKMHVVQVKKAKTRVTKILANIAMFSLAFGIFYGIGWLRLAYLEDINPKLADRVTPVLFALISSVFFLGCVFAKMLHSVSAEDRKKAKAYKEQKQELQKLQEAFEKVDEELKVLPEQKENQVNEVLSLIKMAEKYQDQVVHEYEGIIGEFILHNNLKRHDGKTIGIHQYRGGIIPPLNQLVITTEIV